MDGLHYTFLVLAVLSSGGLGFCLYLLWRIDYERVRMESYLVSMSGTLTDFFLKIDSMFSQSIHYYDETIYAFIQDLKSLKNEMDDVLDEYDELREYIIKAPTDEEKADQQQKEILGVVRPDI